jgi:prepilin-type N-terminal cleavage/methylation domain-containing protein
MSIYNKQAGFSLIELMIAIAFIAVTIVSIFRVSAFNSYIRKTNTARTQAIYHAVQGLEASRLIIWSDLTTGDHGLVQENNTWHLTSQPDLLDGKYLRTIRIEDVYRTNISNGNVYGNISSSSNLDPDSKKVIVTVSWTGYGGKHKEEVLETYLHRFRANRWSQIDWSGGAGQTNWADKTKFDTKNAGIDVTIPGVSTLIAGFLDWNEATTTATYSTSGTSDDNDVFELNGRAYVVTDNNSSGPEFYILNVNNIRSPQLLGSFNVGDGVTAVVVQGNYAYISTRANSGEFQVLNISNPSNIQRVATINLTVSGTNDAKDIVVNNNQAYIVQGNTLYSYNITNPNSPQPLDNVSISYTGNEIFVSENYVYVATEDSSKELQIIDITNPANIFLAGQYNLSGSLQATDVNVRGSRAYVSTRVNSNAEFYIFDLEDPIDPQLIGSYETGYDINAFSVVGPYALLGVALSSEELRVIDISFPATINKVSGFDLYGSILGMSANCAVIYAATTGDAGEFTIISTEATNCQYASSGTLTSSVFDTGSDQVVYNWIKWSGIAPQNTSIRFQLASSNNIAGPWNFVGPDGTASTFYTNGSIDYINYNFHANQRYLRYSLYLDTSSELQVPVLEDVTISYSTYP